MKKIVIKRAIIAFPMGIALGYVITIIISLAVADGYYSPVVPSLVGAMGSEIGAVLLQTLLCGMLSSIFAAISVIWEMDEWSIVKQSGIYFLVASMAMMPIAYFSHWMPHSLIGFIVYFGIFTGIYLVVWLVQYLILRSKIKKLNSTLT